jgi:acetolactate synthase I/II/III large subunit
VLVADQVARCLREQGVDHVFEVVGGMIAPLIDALHRDGAIRIVSMHHEQAAAFAADGHARLTGVPGVAMATSGPGALNLLTGIGSCHFDSTPAVFITGQVSRAEQKGDRPIRQLGFQETEIASVASPIVKAAWSAREPADVPRLLDAAFALARSGRPGPVLVDIPIDLQSVEVADDLVPADPADPAGPAAAAEVGAALGALIAADRPLMLVGGGVRGSGAVDAARAFIDALGVPVVSSLMGIDVLPTGHPLRVGMIGTYGNRWANIALGTADCLLVLGSRLDIRQTGADVAAFKGERQIFHVDCDPGEINNRLSGCIGIVADVGRFLESASDTMRGRRAASCGGWLEEIDALRQRWPDTGELPAIAGINPNELMHSLARASSSAAAYVTDVGQHQMWAAQSLELAADQRFITSGGMGAMGSGLPLAIGVALAARGRPVVLVAGDAGLQLNIQELQTIVRNRLPIKIVVLDNQCHGMVRQFQETYFERRFQSTMWGYSAPDFDRVAEAYGIEAGAVSSDSELPGALDQLWRSPDAPFLLEVAIDPLANAYPKIAFGRPITEMEPLAAPLALRGQTEST